MRTTRQFRRERFERVEKGGQLRPAIMQSPFVSNFARQFAGETKVRRRHFLPSSRYGVRGRAVKGGINFDCEEVARVILQPAVGRPIWRIKCTAPFLEAPGAGSDANFLLLDQLQSVTRNLNRHQPSANAFVEDRIPEDKRAFSIATPPAFRGVAPLDGTGFVHYPAPSE